MVDIFLADLPATEPCDWEQLFLAGPGTPLDGELQALLTANPERWGLSNCEALLQLCAASTLVLDHGLADWAARWQRFCDHGERCLSRREEAATLVSQTASWAPPVILATRLEWDEAVLRYARHLPQHAPQVAANLLRQRMLIRQEAAARCEVAVEYGRMVYGTAVDLMSGDKRVASFVASELARPDLSPASFLQRFVPGTPAYARLLDAHRRYRQIVVDGGFPSLPPGCSQLRRNRRKDPRHGLLASRLAAEGLLGGAPVDVEPVAFGADLQSAMKRFQRMHHLAQTGAVGPATLAALNISAQSKVEALQRALAAYRAAVPPWESTFIFVQMPAAFLEYYVGGQLRRRQRVVLGRPELDLDGTRPMATPVLNSAITAVIFNPEWHVPGKIAREELEPAIAKDPAYLNRHHFRREVSGKDRVRYVQSPGDHNALGRVKFHFANSHDVYLHDTPRRHFFRLPSRLLSHGCVRVEKAIKLATLMLSLDQGFGWAALRQTLKSGETTEFRLKTPVPVHLVYSTAAADADGNLHFTPDLYGRESTP